MTKSIRGSVQRRLMWVKNSVNRKVLTKTVALDGILLL
jgi:hypothetical protein